MTQKFPLVSGFRDHQGTSEGSKVSAAQLWTARELAAYLRYSEGTIARMVSQCPDKLPPRITGLGKPRWHPHMVEKWVLEQSQPSINRRAGRPRNVV